MPFDRISITVLGSGTSVGVPTIGCDCAVCLSSDPRDNRTRPSVIVQYRGRTVLIDAGPDFRQQALRAGFRRIDAVLFTHGHADHILGLDDLRPFNYHQRNNIPIYATLETLEVIQRVFRYIFDGKPTESSRPRIDAHVLDGKPFDLFGLEFVPLALKHGSGTTIGYRFGNCAYLTDHSEIPEEALEQLTGLDILFLDALRHKPHPTHSTVEKSLAYVRRLEPKRAWFTHICHDLGHASTEARLPENVRLAHDGLCVSAAYTPPFLSFRSMEEVDGDFGPSVVTIGNFDGAHLGHRALFRRASAIAKEQGWRAGVLTFDPHPTQVVGPDRAPLLLSSIEERVAMMREEGIERVLVLPFDGEVARLGPEEFVREILAAQLKARCVIVGDNFRFGKKQKGDTAALQRLGAQFGFAVEVVPAITWRGHTVSSTAIRKALKHGNVSFAARLLGRPFRVTREVVPGLGIGSRQTVPTLNVLPPDGFPLANGVYVTRASDGERRWDAITNVGERPTFEGEGITIETFLLSDFDGETPATLTVEFLLRIRGEQKFPSPEALKAQILRDVERARAFHRRARRWVSGS